MPAVASTLLPLGTAAPAFALPAANPEVAGDPVTLDALARGARGVVVVFTCNHCPYAVHVEDRLIGLARAWQRQGIATVAISSNDAEAYPADAFDRMAERAREKAYPFPYLYDATQEVARAYDAACTPDFYLFDADLELVYRGRLDDSRPPRPGRPGRPRETNDLDEAVQALLRGEPVPEPHVPSLGCSIKWRGGA